MNRNWSVLKERLPGVIGALIILVALITTSRLDAVILFHDDFDDNTLDSVTWDVASNTIGRTQFGSTPLLANGTARIAFNTHNPDDPGNTFKGTEIKTKTEFRRDSGVDFEARIKVNEPIANGLVVAFFMFGFDNTNLTSDEIDFELLSNWINDSTNANRALLSTWNNFDENNSLPDQNFTTNQLVDGLDAFDFNTYRIRWLTERTEWYVNDEFVFSTSEVLPDDPMSLRLNFWAPRSTFGIAFDGRLQPTADQNLNSQYVYEVDHVSVKSLAVPEPSTFVLVLVGVLCSVWRYSGWRLSK